MPGYHARLGYEGLDRMSQQSPGRSGRRGDIREWARPALAAGLLALVAVGLRNRVPAPSLDGPFHHHGLLIGLLLEVVLAGLLAALMIRNARAPRDALLAAQLRRLLTYVVGAGLVVIPAAYLLSRRVRPPRPRSITPPKTKGYRLRVPPPSHSTAGWLIVIIILGVLIAAVLVYFIVVLIRGRIWLGFRRGAAGIAVELAEPEDESDLLEAVESGRSALRQFDDARAAIIACYVAMEESLVRAGAARAVADTPDELLARASSQGLVHTGAAARLTALFYEARFSTHRMPSGKRDEAQRALSELAARLGDPEPAGTRGGPDGSAGGGGGGPGGGGGQ
jgi:Domain of unknown function (DUF4129)